MRAQALQRPQRLTLSAGGLSDFARFDRAEGFAVGGGLASRFGGGFGAQLRGRYGIDDRQGKGSGTLEWQSPRWGVRAFAMRDFRDAGDIQERSRLVNSIAAQEFGVRRHRPSTFFFFFFCITTDDQAFALSPTTVGRAFASMSLERPFDSGRLVLMTAGGAVGAGGNVPAQEWLYFGGPVSAPGYVFHELTALAGVTQRVEWRASVPAPSISLGRFGKVPGRATLAPFAQATFARRAAASDVAHPTGVYPSAGIALQPFFDLLRLEVARGLRHGTWMFNVDVSRDFWGVL